MARMTSRPLKSRRSCRVGPGALRLAPAAVQGGRPDTAAQEVLGQPVHRVLGVQAVPGAEDRLPVSSLAGNGTAGRAARKALGTSRLRPDG